MSQPWLTVALLFAAGWTAFGIRVVHRALRGRRGLRLLGVRGVRTEGDVARGPRREGADLHPAQVRYQAGPHHQTYRRAPLNSGLHTLRTGHTVVVRYDPADPRRVVVVRTRTTFTPMTNLVWGVLLCLFGVGLGVWAVV
ncbi:MULTISPECIES: DUF3592 domain-containing protein [unclassified Streptomyces]|uniref:DUF3592 domain-containing protein n=1 Tax=unclassified Streptomyces TaxID=2593676 RepID=UPI00244295EF|nr:DUF3592 domain-containing protein [Streptomyces sp. DH41]MDG9721649.1 DUF3592 domain-containing protein [Streptomyces sp. DH41]